jgi:hypothetical protein
MKRSTKIFGWVLAITLGFGGVSSVATHRYAAKGPIVFGPTADFLGTALIAVATCFAVILLTMSGNSKK